MDGPQTLKSPWVTPLSGPDGTDRRLCVPASLPVCPLPGFREERLEYRKQVTTAQSLFSKENM
ncbi:hypothetical protein KAM370_25640 [Aeromonas caviae]|nr:hypothetical protein KAM370_25640 [Aeromonas caviae]